MNSTNAPFNPLEKTTLLPILLDMLVDVHHIIQGRYVERFDHERIAHYYLNNGYVDFYPETSLLTISGHGKTPQPIAQLDDLLLYARLENEELSGKPIEKPIFQELGEKMFVGDWKNNRDHYREVMRATIRKYSSLFQFSPDVEVHDLYHFYNPEHRKL